MQGFLTALACIPCTSSLPEIKYDPSNVLTAALVAKRLSIPRCIWVAPKEVLGGQNVLFRQGSRRDCIWFDGSESVALQRVHAEEPLVISV